jgi:hypothetical protein
MLVFRKVGAHHINWAFRRGLSEGLYYGTEAILYVEGEKVSKYSSYEIPKIRPLILMRRV